MPRTKMVKMRMAAALCLLLMATVCAAQEMTLKQEPALKTGRYGMPAVVIGQSIAVVGGSGPDGFLNDIERIDFADGRVSDIATHLLPRRYHTAQVQGSYLYVLGGVTGADTPAGITPVFERYDLRDGKIQRLSPLPTPRRLAASVLADGKIYVIGGSDRTGHRVGTVEVYDIASDTWFTGQPMPTPRETALALKDGTIYAVAGYDGSVPVAAFEAYDIARDTWRKLPDLPFTMSAHHMAADGDYLFSFGDYAQLDRVSAYNFTTGHWSLLAGTGYRPSRHNAVVSDHGSVYVLGGNVASVGSNLDTIQSNGLQPLAFHALETAAREAH